MNEDATLDSSNKFRREPLKYADAAYTNEIVTKIKLGLDNGETFTSLAEKFNELGHKTRKFKIWRVRKSEENL